MKRKKYISRYECDGKGEKMDNETINPVLKKVSFGLLIGIIFLPIIFVWTLLKDGYSNKARVIGFIWLAIATLITISNMANSDKTSESIAKTNVASVPVEQPNIPSGNNNVIAVKQTANIGYFDITVNACLIKNSLYFSEYDKLGPEEGAKFVVVDLSLKNTSKESRMMFEGELELIGNDGQKLVMDNTETVFEDGYGLLLDSINPMLTR